MPVHKMYQGLSERECRIYATVCRKAAVKIAGYPDSLCASIKDVLDSNRTAYVIQQRRSSKILASLAVHLGEDVSCWGSSYAHTLPLPHTPDGQTARVELLKSFAKRYAARANRIAAKGGR